MTLTPRRLAVLRAALQFWLDEMGPHPPEAAEAYFDDAGSTWDPREVASIRDLLTHGVRYAVYDASRQELRDTQLYLHTEEAETAAGSLAVATVILPVAMSPITKPSAG